MNREQIDIVIQYLRELVAGYPEPLTEQMITEYGKDPYIILISCLISLRAKDSVTIHVCRDLFSFIRTPEELIALPHEELERLIYKSGFYKNKAKVLRRVSEQLLERRESSVPLVPNKLSDLLALHGVGLKTANLVLSMAFDVPAICVDTHVHRISNIFGLVQTKTPDETEAALKKVLPREYWIEWNRLLVMWGQNICTPPRPKCSQCPIRDLCPRIGVVKYR